MNCIMRVGVFCLSLAFLVACSSQTETSFSADIADAVRIQDARLIPIDGTRNLRDLGGYEMADGRVVKHGLIYRSDNLGHLTRAGKKELAALNIVAITDLRSDPEREQEPDKIPKVTPPIDYTVLPINDAPVDIKKISRKILKGEVNEAEIMTLLDHRRFITNPGHRKSWGDWVKSLNEPQNTPQLFHCTSGKDRAGYGAAILLLTLGASKETVMNDFLFSNQVYAGYIDKTVKKIDRFMRGEPNTDLIRKVMGVSPETLDATFAQMEADFGSIDGFITDGLGIDAQTRQKLQDKFLE